MSKVRAFILCVGAVIATACHSAQSIGATRAWTSNYVQRVVNALPTGTGLTAEQAMEYLSSLAFDYFDGGGNSTYVDDFTTTNGVVTMYASVLGDDGLPDVRRFNFTTECGVVFSTDYFGARITSSSLATNGLAVGTLLANTADGHLENKNDARIPDFAISGTNLAQTVVVYEDDCQSWTSQFDTNGVLMLVKKVGGKIVGSLHIEPIGLTEAEFTNLTSKAAGRAAWCVTATNVTASLGITFYKPTTAVSARARRSLMAGSSYMGQCVVPLMYTGPDMVDYNTQYPPSEGYTWVPSTGYPQGAWHNAANWSPQFPTTATIQYEGDDGELVTVTRVVRNANQLRALFSNYETRIPPTDYTYPELKQVTFACEEYGHAWGAGCVCTRCGEKRAHTFSACAAGATECAKCENALTEVKWENGEYVVRETGEVCGAHDPEAVESHHAGWHHEGPETVDGQDSPKVYCACACGVYGQDGWTLNHNEGTWGSYEEVDSTYHRKSCQCTRCGFTMYKYATHEVDPATLSDGETSNLTYANQEQHYAVGQCKDCGADVNGLVEHMWGYYGTDQDKYCACPCFQEDGADSLSLMHAGADAFIQNAGDSSRSCTGLRYCVRCGSPVTAEDMGIDSSTEASIHNWSYPTSGTSSTKNATYHWCACGQFTDNHYFSEDGTCEKGVTYGGPGCGYTRSGQSDNRDGKDSVEVVDRPTDTNDDGGNGNGGGGVNPPLPAAEPPSDPTPPSPPPPTPPSQPDPLPPPDPPLPPMPTPDPDDPNPFGGGNSSTVDPNCHWNTPPFRVTGQIKGGGTWSVPPLPM